MKVTEIHLKTSEVNGENITSGEMVWKWVRAFKDGHTNVHYVGWSRWPSVINEDLCKKLVKSERQQKLYDLIIIKWVSSGQEKLLLLLAKDTGINGFASFSL